MEKVNEYKNVSLLESNNEFVFIGVNTLIVSNSFINGGNKILKLKEGEIIDSFSQQFSAFKSFHDGVLYQEKSGDPLFYYDFLTKINIKVTEDRHYLAPVQSKFSKNIIQLYEMDELFKKQYYLFTNDLEKKLLPKYAKVILENYFVSRTYNTIELYSLKTFQMLWQFVLPEDLKKDSRNEIFSNGESVFIPLVNGAFISLDIETGKIKWRWECETIYPSYGCVGDFIYVHAGLKITEVDKHSGKTTRIIDYKSIPELEKYHSTGEFYCFDDIIVVKGGHSTGEVVVFDRLTLKVIGRELVDGAGIANVPFVVYYKNGYLYIRGMSRTVHIYKFSSLINKEKLA